MVQSLTAPCHVGLVRQIPFVCNRNGFAGILEKVGLIDEAIVSFNQQFLRRCISVLSTGTCTWTPTCMALIVSQSCRACSAKKKSSMTLEVYGHWVSSWRRITTWDKQCWRGSSTSPIFNLRFSVLQRLAYLHLFSAWLTESMKLHRHKLPGANGSVCDVTSLETRFNFNSIHRWAKLRQSIVPLTLLEPHSESLLCGLLASWAVHVVTSVSPLVTFGAHLLAWLILDYVIFIVMQVRNWSAGAFLNFSLLFCRIVSKCPFSKCEFLLAWLVRESTSLFLFLRAYSSSELTWRNKRYLLDWGGIGREVPSTRKPQISEVWEELTQKSSTVTEFVIFPCFVTKQMPLYHID